MNDRPWLPCLAIEYLERLLRPDWKVFEYGSGGSTLFFASRVSKVVSVEHDSQWAKNVLPVNCDRRFIPLTDTPCDPEYCASIKSNLSGQAYASEIDKFSSNYFDLVLIDGRSRPGCLKHACAPCKVRKGGWIVIDNTDRLAYGPAIKTYLDKWPYVHICDGWSCSFWRRP